MMKELKLIIAVVLLCISSFAQVQDEAIDIIEGFNNGKLNYNREYTQLNDSSFLMKQYYTNGDLFQESEMKMGLTIDTSYTKDLHTQQMRMQVCSFEGYINHGNYRSFDSRGELQMSGQFKNGIRVGKWLSFYPYATAVTLYDDYGNYIETKSYFDNEQAQLQHKGKYCLIDSKSFNYMSDSDDDSFTISKQNVPCGEWQYFDKEGNLIKKITYEYVDWK